MSMTLILQWDIKDGTDEEEYFEFMAREWGHVVNRLGLQPVEGWLTKWRIDNTVPLVRLEVLAEDEDTIRQVLDSTDWTMIQSQLMNYVENYRYKIVETTGGFRL